MQSFIIKRQPKAYQGSKTFKSKTSRANYENDLGISLKKFNPHDNSFDTQELYGLIYYFFKINTGTDPDNISKPIWDCLKGKLFNDDKQVKLRTAASFDLTKNDFNILDFSGVKGEVIVELLDAFDNEEHVVYIECGVLNMNMYKFNLAANGN